MRPHGSRECTQRFAHPLPSFEETFAISNTRMSCGKRTSGEARHTFPTTAGKPGASCYGMRSQRAWLER